VKTIALFNIKGGVGKTTSAVNIAYLAAQAGLRTALWDLDPQGHASWYLGIDTDELKQRAAKLMEGKLAASELLMPTAYENLSVVPADLSLRKLDVLFEKNDAGKNHFKSLLKSLARFAIAILPSDGFAARPRVLSMTNKSDDSRAE